MKNKNHSPSYKKKNSNSKSLLSSTIEYIKNDLKNEYTFDQNTSKQNEINTNKEAIDPKRSKS
jgi:hypothetical protein